MLKKTLQGVTARPELLILLLMVMIIAMLIIPLPTYLVDFLIGLNIVIAILVFVGAFYIERILNFSSFPSILLITTLFRLALSISTSRLILLNGDAGEIINTFGQFVIGDSLVVGFVIFSIVTIVQFIVITKGSERVAEVAARFSLDAMPGKQMSIDADLRAGLINVEGVRQRRSVLERESQLYGSFDGAMKFVKGDAIASIIIIFVNFIGGISVGVLKHGMDISTALDTYTILTIGDGLVAQIPALLIAISAGFIVTRVGDDEKSNMGKMIMKQILGSSSVLVITSVVAVCIGLLPGFPLVVFLILGGALCALYLWRWRALRKQAAEPSASSEGVSGETVKEGWDGLSGDVDKMVAETVPLLIMVPKRWHAQLADMQIEKRYRNLFFRDYGCQLPEIALLAEEHVPDNCAVLLINEIRVEEFTTYFDHLRIVDNFSEIDTLEIPHIKDKSGDTPAIWVAASYSKMLSELNVRFRDATDELYQNIAATLLRNVNEFFGIHETKQMLDKLEGKYPDLLKEVYRHATVQRIGEVLQRLLSERISIRSMKLILEAMAHWAPREKDSIMLVEHVRGALGRYICDKFSVRNRLRVIVLSPELEDTVRKGIRNTSAGNFLNLDPAVMETVMDKFTLAFRETLLTQKDIVVLAAVDIRRFVKKLVENRFRELEVLSFSEITENISINVVKSIN